jgi:hypothetical protein
MRGYLWDYIILETIRKYATTVEISLLKRAVYVANKGPEFTEDALFTSLDLSLEIYIKEDLCAIDNTEIGRYCLTPKGLCYLYYMKKHTSYDVHYKTHVMNNDELVLGSIVIGAVSLLLWSLKFVKPNTEVFNIVLKAILKQENIKVFAIDDIVKHQVFTSYHYDVMATTNLKTKPGKQAGKNRIPKMFDERLIGSLIMVETLVATLGNEYLICITALLPIYLCYHKMPNNGLIIPQIRKTQQYKGRKMLLVEEIRGQLALYKKGQ